MRPELSCGEIKMLSDKLREGAQGKIFKLLFWIIILSFIFAGVGGYLIPRLNTDPVKVGDYSITANEWNEQYNRETQQMHRMYGAEASKLLENPAYVNALRTRVLESLINHVAFSSAVFDSGVRIGDEQVREVIRRTPAFQRDGKFDNELYLASVRNMGMNPEYFGEQLRLSLMTDFVGVPAVNTSGAPLPYEVTAMGRLLTQYRVVDLYSLDLTNLEREITASDAEVQEFYEANHDRFMAPAQVKFTYLLLDTNELKKDITYTDADLQDYLTLNQEDFRTPERRAVRHILVKADAADGAERIAKIDAALASGEDFAALASEYSDDPSAKDSGGFMGEVTREDLAANLSDAAFALSEGQVSQKITDNFGTHYLKVDKIYPPALPDFAQVKTRLASAYVADKARELYQDKLNSMADMSFENPDSLDLTAETLGLKVQTCDGLNQGDDKAPWPLNTQALQDAAFSEDNYTSGINTPVVNLSDTSAVVLNISDYRAAELRTLDEVKDEAAAVVVQKKAMAQGRTILTDFVKALKADPNAALPKDVSVISNVRLERGSGNVDPNFGMAVFAIPQQGDLNYTIGDNQGRETLALLKSVGSLDDKTLGEYESLMRTQLVQYYRGRMQDVLYLGARELTDIEYNEDAIKLINQQNQDAE